MNRVVRALLTCLLLVSVPMHGYAAAGMLFCGQATGTRGGPAVHHHTTVAAPDGSDAVAVALHDTNGGERHGAGSCSVCATCCSPAALPTSAVVAAAHAPRSTPAIDIERPDPGHGPARLERPPRLLA